MAEKTTRIFTNQTPLTPTKINLSTNQNMVQLNFATKECKAKLVYYGPGMSGKTTNLEVVHRLSPKGRVGDLLSISTEGDRTLVFDYLPMELGKIAGMDIKFQIYTVPGQNFYAATRKFVLQGADGIIFVADSQEGRMRENLESLREMYNNLKEHRIEAPQLPLVMQWNKRDLDDVMEVELMEEKLNLLNSPSFEAIAIQGKGVMECLKTLIQLTLEQIKYEIGSLSPEKPSQTLPSSSHSEEKKINSEEEIEAILLENISTTASTTQLTQKKQTPPPTSSKELAKNKAPEVGKKNFDEHPQKIQSSSPPEKKTKNSSQENNSTRLDKNDETTKKTPSATSLAETSQNPIQQQKEEPRANPPNTPKEGSIPVAEATEEAGKELKNSKEKNSEENALTTPEKTIEPLKNLPKQLDTKADKKPSEPPPTESKVPLPAEPTSTPTTKNPSPKPPSTSTPSSNTKTSEPPSKSQAKLWQLLQAKEERLEYELAKRTSSPPSSKKEQSPPYLQALRQGKALENLELEVLDLSHEVFEQKVLLKNASIRYLKAVGSVFKQDFVCKSCRIEVINMGSQLDKKTKTHFCKQWILEDVEVQNKADFRNALFEEKGQMYFVHFPPQGYFTFFQAKFQHSLEILNSRLGAIDLREVDCGGNFSIKESKILGQFNARKAHFQQSVLVADSQFHDKFILSHAHFQGSVAIVNSLFEKSLLWQGSKFSSTFEVRDGWAEGNVFLNQACFEQNARFCAHFEGAVYASGATFQGTLDLSNAQFSSKLALKNARIQGKIKMDHLKSNELEIQWQQVHKNLLSEEEGDYSQASKEYALLLEVFERKRHYREWDECYLAYRRAKRSSLNPNTLSKKLRKALEYCLDLSCGYGVYPFRLLSFGGVAVILFACLYFLFAQSNLVLANKALNISFEKALYFSLATFVGLETGWTPHPNSGIKWLVTLEALVGLSTFLCFLLLLGRRWFRF